MGFLGVIAGGHPGDHGLRNGKGSTSGGNMAGLLELMENRYIIAMEVDDVIELIVVYDEIFAFSSRIL